jgi:hypothetical protein
MVSPRFQGPAEKLGNVSTLPGIEIPDAIRDGEASLARLVASIPLGSTALIDTEFRLPGIGDKPIRASFIESSELALGRDEGRHEPRFGQMILNGAGLHERPILVAIKPFNASTDNHPDILLRREWGTSNYLNSLSDRQLTYIPLGIWRTKEGVNNLITLYEHDVKSYDNVFWADRDLSPEALREQTVEHALSDCIRGLGYLHGLGLAHTDAEAKNLAANFSGVRFIDLEGVRHLPQKDNAVTESKTTINLIRNDIETLFDSTIQVDENRSAIAPVLAKSSIDYNLAKIYLSGIRQASVDGGIKMPDLPTTSPEYFKNTIDHTLKIASSPSPRSNQAPVH